ncbi:MAG: hypothetical protein L3K19_09475 [Thermoplasmata archaeon]|nr:hypothetical protein [Thermoplasmata archaeon]
MSGAQKPRPQFNPRAGPSPNYNIQVSYNFAIPVSGKALAVAYVIRANRKGRITMTGFMPATSSSYNLYGCVLKVSGGPTLVLQNASQKYVYENDAAPDAGTIALSKDMGLGTIEDVLFGDLTNVGQIELGGGLPHVFPNLPFTLLAVGGPEMGPLVGKDAIQVEAGDIIALVMATSSPGNGVIQAEIDGRPYLEE